MIIGGILEFVLGNTFPFVVFCSFGGFWLTFGVTLIPFYNAYGAYSTTGTAADGLNTQGFNASFGESYKEDTVRPSAGESVLTISRLLSSLFHSALLHLHGVFTSHECGICFGVFHRYRSTCVSCWSLLPCRKRESRDCKESHGGKFSQASHLESKFTDRAG
jgi:hypothetical protein